MKSAAQWVAWSVLFIVPFLPLFVVNDFFFPFISSKGFAFRILIELGIGAWVILALSDKAYRPRFSWPLAIYGVFVVWMFIADLVAPNPHKAFWSNYERMDGWVTMVHAFLFAVLAGSVLQADKLWNKWWNAVLIGSTLVSLYGLWQIFGFTQIHQGGVRADASFGNAIYLAVYLMFTVGIALWRAFESKGWLRYSLIALSLLQVVIIFFTATRGVILGMFAAAVFLAILWAVKEGGASRKIATVSFAVLALVGVAFFAARNTDFVRSEPTLTRLASVFEASELKVRATLWSMGYEGFLERPITGWGQEGYNYVFNKYYKPSLYEQEPWFDRAHNTYIDWLVAGGLPAFLLFIGLLVATFVTLARASLPRTQKYLLLTIIVGYALQAGTAFDNLFSYVLFAAIIAMVHSAVSRPIPALESAPVLSSGTLSPIAAPVILVVTVAVVWVVNVPGVSATSDLIVGAKLAGTDPAGALAAYTRAANSGSFATQEIAEQTLTFAGAISVNAAVPVEIRQQAFTLALTLMRQEVERTPTDARIRLMYAQGLRAAGDQAGYRKEMDAAIALTPRKQAILFQRAIIKLQDGDRAGAAADFKAGYELDPSFKTPALYAAVADIITGHVAEGKALLIKEYGTTGVDDVVLRYAYYDAKLFNDLVASAKTRADSLPNDVQAHFELAQAYVFAGRMQEARAEIDAIVAAHPETAATAAQFLKQVGL